MVEIVLTPDPLLSLSPVVPELSFFILEFLFQQGISNGFFLNGIIAQFYITFLRYRKKELDSKCIRYKICKA
jgi:hypothetical protein